MSGAQAVFSTRRFSILYGYKVFIHSGSGVPNGQIEGVSLDILKQLINACDHGTFTGNRDAASCFV